MTSVGKCEISLDFSTSLYSHYKRSPLSKWMEPWCEHLSNNRLLDCARLRGHTTVHVPGVARAQHHFLF